MKVGKFQDISREILGENWQLIQRLRDVNDQSAVERILLGYKANIKAVRGAMRKSLVKKMRSDALQDIQRVIAIDSAEKDVESGDFSPGILVALLQISIDANTDLGRQEWALLEEYTSSKAATETLIVALRAWLAKMAITEVKSTHWVDVWKLYAARKLTPATPSARPSVLDAKKIGKRMDEANDLQPETIRDYFLALCHGRDDRYTNYILSATANPEGLCAFAKNVIRLANQCAIPDPDKIDEPDSEPQPISRQFVDALPLLLSQIDTPFQRITPDPLELKAAREAKKLTPNDRTHDADVIRLSRNADGILRPSDSDVEDTSDHSGPISLGELAHITRSSAAGDFELMARDESDVSRVQAILSASETNADGLVELSVDRSGVTTTADLATVNAGGTGLGLHNSDSGKPKPERVAVRAASEGAAAPMRRMLSRRASWTARIAAIAASFLITDNIAHRQRSADASQPTAVSQVRVTTSLNSLRKEETVPPMHALSVDHAVPYQVVSTPLVFHTSEVLPQGPNTCIMGGAKHVLRTAFHINDEFRLEQLAALAENAIKAVRSSALHTRSGDQVSMAYDETVGLWLVRQLRGDEVVAQATFNDTSMTQSYLKPNLFNRLWNKGKSLWQIFKGWWA